MDNAVVVWKITHQYITLCEVGTRRKTPKHQKEKINWFRDLIRERDSPYDQHKMLETWKGVWRNVGETERQREREREQ